MTTSLKGGSTVAVVGAIVCYITDMSGVPTISTYILRRLRKLCFLFFVTLSLEWGSNVAVLSRDAFYHYYLIGGQRVRNLSFLINLKDLKIQVLIFHLKISFLKILLGLYYKKKGGVL